MDHFPQNGIASGSFVDWPRGRLSGGSVQTQLKRLGNLNAAFSDTAALSRMNPDTLIYTVRWHQPVDPETEGGLLWGTTTIEPGVVGDEYFMTRGHFHSRRNRGEYYCTAAGSGVLLLMDEQGVTRNQLMSPNSLHYIPGHTAHRVVNTGDTSLSFWACWPADAGHDYDAILSMPFGVRVLRTNGGPTFVKVDALERPPLTTDETVNGL